MTYRLSILNIISFKIGIFILIGSLVNTEIPKVTDLFLNDKIIHFISYFFLVLPVSFNENLNKFTVFYVAFLFGLAIEFLQPFFNRSAEVLDVIFNLLGILTSLYLSYFIKIIVRKFC